MANIFAQYAQPVRSIQDYQASYDAQDLRREQLGAAKRTNALADLTAEQARQTIADGQRSQNVIRQVYSAFDPSAGPDALFSALERTGDRAAIDLAGVKRKEATERRKGESEAGAKDVETENKVIGTYRDLIGNAANPQQAAQYVQIMHSDPRLKGTAIARVPLDQALSQIGSDPQTFNEWKQKFALGAAKFVEMNKPTYQQQNLGGTMQTLALPGLGGAPTVAATAPITQSADNAATQATSTANNKRTVGASLANAAAVRDAAATTARGNVDAAKVKRDQDTEMKLADDYRAQSKEFGQSLSAHKQLTATLGSATTSPAATLAAATKFMKILDPGSVVRESELGMALAASGVIDRAMNYVSTLQSGQKLTPTQAKDFKNISDKMFTAAQQVQQGIDADYKAKAKTYGLRPEMVVQDLGQNAKEISFGDLK